jgi:uncharacterized protein (TIGR03905 family)
MDAVRITAGISLRKNNAAVIMKLAKAVLAATEKIIENTEVRQMHNYSYRPRGVCSRQITFGIEDGKLYNVRFMGGCPGNLAAIGKLLEGQSAEEAVRILKGNDCSGRGTSCADQLAKAVEKALAENA